MAEVTDSTAAWQALSPPDLHLSDDESFFLDSRRGYRIRADCDGEAVAVRRDGVVRRLGEPFSVYEDLAGSPAFAQRMFHLAAPKNEPAAMPRRRFLALFDFVNR